MPRLFHLSALFDEDADLQARRAELSAAWNEHLGQSHPRVKLAGPLSNTKGEHVGMMTIIEATDMDEARAYYDKSPYREAGLYGTSHINELSPEVGRIA